MLQLIFILKINELNDLYLVSFEVTSPLDCNFGERNAAYTQTYL